MSKGSYSAAVLGCGHIAEKHVLGYRWAGIPVVGVADINEERAQSFANQYDIGAAYKEYRKLLDDIRPDIVSICTWPLLHEEMALAAVEAGAKAVVAEKPLATSLGVADRIIGACRSAGVLLVVGHQRRYEDHWVRAHELIAEGAVGKVERVLLSHGGDILSDGVHGIDLSLFLTGDPQVEWVLGQIDRTHFPADEYRRKVDVSAEPGAFGKMQAGWRYGHLVEDSTTFSAGLASGIRLIGETGKIKPSQAYISIAVLGSEGQLTADTNGRVTVLTSKGRREERFGEEYTEVPFGKEMRDVVRVLDGELSQHPLDVEHHRSALEVSLSVFESARLRRRIVLPLQTPESALEIMVESGEI